MRLLENEDFYWEKLKRYLEEQGHPNALVVTVNQTKELIQCKSKETVYRHFSVTDGKIQVAEIIKFLCKCGKCKA
jgi:hypothetical protein